MGTWKVHRTNSTRFGKCAIYMFDIWCLQRVQRSRAGTFCVVPRVSTAYSSTMVHMLKYILQMFLSFSFRASLSPIVGHNQSTAGSLAKVVASLVQTLSTEPHVPSHTCTYAVTEPLACVYTLPCMSTELQYVQLSPRSSSEFLNIGLSS